MTPQSLATNTHECTRIRKIGSIRVHLCSFVAILGFFVASLPAADQSPRIVFTRSFPGSMPPYFEISIDRSGEASYKESSDDDPETFKLNAESTAAIFDLAAKLGHFKRPLESGMKVANMGVKAFRWEDGAESNQVKFNYSVDENARALHDWFERIAESERTFVVLRRAARHDRLGVNDAVVSTQSLWEHGRLASPEQFLPLLDQISGNEVYMNIARERAAAIAGAIRARQRP
jgi:hypothetical protein